MLSILACHSYFLRFDQKQQERARPYPPLATLQVAATLREAGHQVALFDAMLAEGIEEYERQLLSMKPQLVLLYEDNFNFLSKMCLGKMRRAACEMIAAACRVGARVIAAGSDVSDSPEAYLRAGADVALIGEGLLALRELLPRLDSQPNAHNSQLVQGVDNVATLIDGKLAITRGSKMAPTVWHDAIPAWDLVQFERYRAVWLKAHGYFSLNMAASKGCSFRCTWCAKPIWGNRYLQRTPAAVASEMAYLKHAFNVDHIWFADDIFGFRVDWVADLATALTSVDGSLPFKIQTRADLVSKPMAQALKDAGCVEAWIGAESGSQRVLDAMNKGTNVDEIVTARERLKAMSIRVGFFIQLGYLNEELSDILATRDLLEAARPDDVGVSVSYPLPGTKFYDLVREQLGPKTHWQDSNDLAMMFQGTYTSDFYRAVRDLLHDQVALEKLNVPERKSEYRNVRRMIQQRWKDLLSREPLFRTASSRPVTVF